MFAIAKRIVLFIAVNILVMLTLTIVLGLVQAFFGVQLAGFEGMIVIYSVIGFGGAFISLALSRIMAKWMMGVKVISPQTQNPGERKLLDMVYSLAQKAKLPAMPEVGIFDSPEVNAFATGPTKARSLVAVSTGLLGRMDDQAIEGVLGHEIAHIANGDMVTMTLLQGVINTLVLIVARVVASLVASQASERARPMLEMVVFYALQIVLSIFGSMVVAVFSRRREFRADAGGARLAGREHMLRGLRSLQGVYGQVDDSQHSVATLKISGHPGGFMALLATHPPLEERIRRLETMTL